MSAPPRAPGGAAAAASSADNITLSIRTLAPATHVVSISSTVSEFFRERERASNRSHRMFYFLFELLPCSPALLLLLPAVRARLCALCLLSNRETKKKNIKQEEKRRKETAEETRRSTLARSPLPLSSFFLLSLSHPLTTPSPSHHLFPGHRRRARRAASRHRQCGRRVCARVQAQVRRPGFDSGP